MRTVTRFLNASALIAIAAVTVAGQPVSPRAPLAGRGPVAQGRMGPMARQGMIERRQLMLERRLEMRGGRMGMRQGRMGPGPGLGGQGRMGLGQGRPGQGRMGPAGRPYAGRFVRDRAIARRAVIGERFRNLTAEQRTAVQKHQEAARTQRQSVIERVRSGALTREQARTEMQKWREGNKPPVDLRRPRPEDGN